MKIMRGRAGLLPNDLRISQMLANGLPLPLAFQLYYIFVLSHMHVISIMDADRQTAVFRNLINFWSIPQELNVLC